MIPVPVGARGVACDGAYRHALWVSEPGSTRTGNLEEGSAERSYILLSR